MDTKIFCDLLIVRYDDRLFVVEAPGCEAAEGDIVEFAFGAALAMGVVEECVYCIKGESEYRFIGRLNTIYPARRIYKRSWEAWEGNDEEGGV